MPSNLLRPQVLHDQESLNMTTKMMFMMMMTMFCDGDDDDDDNVNIDTEQENDWIAQRSAAPTLGSD